MQETYTIEDVAAMSGLSTRTVRNYLSMGLLDGEKVDGVWRFTPEQFVAFLSQDMVRQSVKAKANGIVYDFLLQEKKPERAACAVLDVPTADHETENTIRETLLERVNALGLRCSYRYEADASTARLIVQGPPASVAELLAALPETD